MGSIIAGREAHGSIINSVVQFLNDDQWTLLDQTTLSVSVTKQLCFCRLTDESILQMAGFVVTTGNGDPGTVGFPVVKLPADALKKSWTVSAVFSSCVSIYQSTHAMYDSSAKLYVSSDGVLYCQITTSGGLTNESRVGFNVAFK
ncbi:hypothetical protein [Levilactobacillus namurensis]|uniref:Uncharacterized protein n=1 Tax=Levilactobacillus namurensis TaxID=380393 RepID=A0AAW8W9W6_9LACO|nr:hypothetical protein [Levilactobacillus namurensis]MDT7015130.1 hypothetical protein [Levilactobacillus namurensis]MDT7015309.1 hypothetical protein [Levilactobacillus namurensis]MDT7015563.1 hypothetical protein [Levilactobacillus namurensis]